MSIHYGLPSRQTPGNGCANSHFWAQSIGHACLDKHQVCIHFSCLFL